MNPDYDVIVIGSGHAGVEAAHAAARLGCSVGLCTLSRETVAHMPCNPAIGGTAKGHLVREIDALGGLMGQAIDATAIQFKLLNRSRGPAVWSPRAQADKRRYAGWMRARLEAEPNIGWIIGRVVAVVVEGGRVEGVELERGERYRCRALVVTTGTFLNGLVHVGREQYRAGRVGEAASGMLGESLKGLGLVWGRLKTGTPPRLDRASIEFSAFEEEPGDRPPVPFSFMTGPVERPQICCHVLHTNEKVHELVRRHLDQSPLYNGQIKGIGPRYCPSLEDKVMRFPQRGGASGVSGAGRGGRSGDLRERLFDEPAAGGAAGGDRCPAGPGDSGDAAAGLRSGVRFHPADRAEADTGDAVSERVVSGRTDQRDIRV